MASKYVKVRIVRANDTVAFESNVVDDREAISIIQQSIFGLRPGSRIEIVAPEENPKHSLAEA